jgi:hypothetical protein
MPVAEDVKHLLFLYSRAEEVWKNLGPDLKINEACAIDRAGQIVLEYLLWPEHLQDSLILGEGTTKETISVTCWYLWWERH